MQTEGWPLCEGGGSDERLTTAGRDEPKSRPLWLSNGEVKP